MLEAKTGNGDAVAIAALKKTLMVGVYGAVYPLAVFGATQP